jgi:hypothetical protein
MKSMAQTLEDELVGPIFSSSTMSSNRNFAYHDKHEPPIYDEVLSKDIEVISTPTYSIRQQDPTNSNLVCVKYFSTARCQGDMVSIIEYSGTYSRKKKHEVLFRLIFVDGVLKLSCRIAVDTRPETVRGWEVRFCREHCVLPLAYAFNSDTQTFSNWSVVLCRQHPLHTHTSCFRQVTSFKSQNIQTSD